MRPHALPLRRNSVMFTGRKKGSEGTKKEIAWRSLRLVGTAPQFSRIILQQRPRINRERLFCSCLCCIGGVLVSGSGALQQQQNNIFSGPRHTHWLNRASGRNDNWGHLQVVVQDSDHRYRQLHSIGTRRPYDLHAELLPLFSSLSICLSVHFCHDLITILSAHTHTLSILGMRWSPPGKTRGRRLGPTRT